MTPHLPLALAITDFGESAVLIATALATSGWFWLSRQRPVALSWLVTLGGCIATILALKLGFLTGGDHVLAGAIHSPSGHAAMASFFYGAVALTAGRASSYRIPLLAAALLLSVAVGISRVTIHAHTPAEVVTGLAVGFAWLAGFALLLRRTALPAPSPSRPAIIGLVSLYAGLMAITLAGTHVTVEPALQTVAHQLSDRLAAAS